jgi:hypothetical protein
MRLFGQFQKVDSANFAYCKFSEGRRVYKRTPERLLDG